VDFSLTPEQVMLRDSIDRFVAEHGDFPAWRRRVADGSAVDTAAWAQMAQLGWLGIAIPEEAGGLGFGPVETMLVMEGLGRALCRVPYAGSCVVAPTLLQAGRVLDGVAAGTMQVAVAADEADARFDLAHVATRAARDGAGWTLTGAKSFVADGASADWFIVPARTSGAVGDAAGISLFLVPASATGLAVQRHRGPDHHHHARLVLAGVAVAGDALIGAMDGGFAALEAAVDRAICAHLAEAVGCMETLRDTTLAYLKTREQFGATLGSFQALQHRMVDMAIACEEARSLLYLATMRLDGPVEARRPAVSAAKARIGQCAMFVAEQAVQLHGGVGTSDELAVSHHLRRLRVIDVLYGDAEHHRRRFAAATDAMAA
jgi:alkylation response protein AidB-like acyl-CoA dehydrogenase